MIVARVAARAASTCRATSSVGFTTGCQMANFVGLAAGRRAVLLKRGWDVEQDGLQGAPRVRVVVGDERHVTIAVALQMLGLGASIMEPVRGRRSGPDAAGRARGGHWLRGDRSAPTLVCCPGRQRQHRRERRRRARSLPIVHELDAAWLHVDGAFGLWARTVPELRPQVNGLDQADSWATDVHKWLNVPYDSGLVIVRDAAAHRASMVHARRVPRRGHRRRARPVRVRARIVTSRARLRALRGAALARPHGRRGSRPAVLRARRSHGRAARRASRASRCSTTSCSTRCWFASVTTTI